MKEQGPIFHRQHLRVYLTSSLGWDLSQILRFTQKDEGKMCKVEYHPNQIWGMFDVF